MTHEPECPAAKQCAGGGICGFCYACESCPDCVCVCAELRAAYQRGREDAAKAVEEAVSHKRNETIMLPTYPPQSACVCGRVWPHVVDPVAAARGENQ